MVENPPYVKAYGTIKNLFQKISEAAVPPKFTTDFMYSILGLKSTSYRAMIPLLKRLGFIDQASVPTQAYRDYRDSKLAKIIMAGRIQAAYADIFSANTYAYKLNKVELSEKVRSLTGAAADDQSVPAIVGTFSALCELADFNLTSQDKQPKNKVDEEREVVVSEVSKSMPVKLGISYTINLNLPATTEIEVFNAIFKSLKEHLLNEK